jgi:hypothetical protein
MHEIDPAVLSRERMAGGLPNSKSFP